MFNFKNLGYIITNNFIFGSFVFLMVNGFSKKSLELVRLSIQLKQVTRMRKVVRKKIKSFNIDRYNIEQKEKHKLIWICWFQGIESAPDIVKICYNSLIKQENVKIKLITDDNFELYTNFPKSILEKRKKGLIPPAHFSDLLRVELLSNHGGIWLDSTVLVTGSSLPDYLIESNFFCYQVLKPGLNGHSIICSSWAMSSIKNSLPLSLVKDVLYDYWDKKNKLNDYFLFHIILSAVLLELEELGISFSRQCNSTPHILQLEMYDKFKSDRLREILNSSGLHKLTYKIDNERLLEESFIEFILRGGL